MLVFIISGLVILAYCSQASNERTYQEVVWAVCGKVTGVLCEVSIAIYTFGTCIAFLIIIGDQQDKSEVPLVATSSLPLGPWGCWGWRERSTSPGASIPLGALPPGCGAPETDEGPEAQQSRGPRPTVTWLDAPSSSLCSHSCAGKGA